jgi:hypothetical protein
MLRFTLNSLPMKHFKWPKCRPKPIRIMDEWPKNVLLVTLSLDAHKVLRRVSKWPICNVVTRLILLRSARNAIVALPPHLPSVIPEFSSGPNCRADMIHETSSLIHSRRNAVGRYQSARLVEIFVLAARTSVGICRVILVYFEDYHLFIGLSLMARHAGFLLLPRPQR